MTTLRTKEKTNEPAWLLDKRRAATDSYKSASAPDRVSHLWKYTDPSIFLPELNELKSGESKIDFSIDNQSLKEGVVLLEINSAMKEKSNLLANYFDRLTSKELNKVNLLNEALWSTGYFLYVPKGVKIEKPVVVKSSVSSALEARRILIILEEGSSINLIDENLS